MTSALINWSTFWQRDPRGEEWAIEPIIPLGRSVSLYSPAKVGKSLLALDLVARAATGQRVLDRPAGAPLRCVYFDLEMTEDDLYERLADMGFGPESDLSNLFYYMLPNLPPLDTPEGGETIVEIAREHNADLVAIDTTSRVLKGAENDADTMRAFYVNTGLPLKADGRTVVRLDHAGKDVTRGQRGTSAKNDDVDLVWQLSLREGGGVRLHATHRRQTWIPEFVDLVRVGEPFRHELAEGASVPAGTSQLVATMNSLGIPLDHGSTKVRAALRDAKVSASNEVIRAAIRERKKTEPVRDWARTGQFEAARTENTDREANEFTDRSRTDADRYPTDTRTGVRNVVTDRSVRCLDCDDELPAIDRHHVRCDGCATTRAKASLGRSAS
jgi:hypothetical protein